MSKKEQIKYISKKMLKNSRIQIIKFNQTTSDVINDVKNNRNLSESFENVEDLFKELEKDY